MVFTSNFVVSLFESDSNFIHNSLFVLRYIVYKKIIELPFANNSVIKTPVNRLPVDKVLSTGNKEKYVLVSSSI